MSSNELRQALKGTAWQSLSVEARPSIVAAASGIKPLYCFRRFWYADGETFRLHFSTFADPFGKSPLVEMDIEGHFTLGEAHPVARGAFEADYTADRGFTITVLNPQLADVLNGQVGTKGSEKWAVNVSRDVLGKAVPAFGLEKGRFFKEYDLVYLYENLLFNGSRNVDGRPFDSPANRPTNLQAPLIGKKW